MRCCFRHAPELIQKCVSEFFRLSRIYSPSASDVKSPFRPVMSVGAEAGSKPLALHIAGGWIDLDFPAVRGFVDDCHRHLQKLDPCARSAR